MNNENLLPENDFHRRIIHLDMDAFYASVEMRDHPELSNKAVVISNDPRKNNGHGVVATANYFARSFGVHSAMPAIKAVKLIPENQLVFVKPDFNKYHAISDQVHEIMHEVTDIIETVALDEAYLDVTKNKLGNYSVIELGNYLQQRIYHTLHLTSSFGASYNKFLAKMGSDYAKPFGRTVILPRDSLNFLANQDIKKFPGIGKKTQKTLRDLNVNNGKDLRDFGILNLIEKFKKSGYYMALHAYGIDLEPVLASRIRKSLGKERTFEPSIFDENYAVTQLRNFSHDVAQSLRSKGLTGKVVVLKLRDSDFKTITRRKMLDKQTSNEWEFYQASRELFEQESEYLLNGIRLLGVSVTDLQSVHYEQINLFSTN